MTAEPTARAHERLVDQTPETFMWTISEYVRTEQEDDKTAVWTEYQIEDGARVICKGIASRELAEDIAAIPLMKQMLQNGIGARMVPVQRSERDLQVAQLQLLEEVLAELKRGNAAERTGSVSSVQIEDFPTKDRPVRVTSKTYAGSPLPVDEALEDHARLHREAEMRAAEGWSNTADRLRSEFVS